jgi:hypothetical protein
MTWLEWAFTVASDCVVVTSILVDQPVAVKEP